MSVPGLYTKLDTPDALILRLNRLQKALIEGVLSAQLADGWADAFLNETSYSSWTSAVVMKSLLRQNVVPANFQRAINKIIAVKQQSGVAGWVLERFAPVLSTYVTADILSLTVVLQMCDEINSIVQCLQNMQNDDGGWGVCEGDLISKVRPTAWVLNSLLEASAHPCTTGIIDQQLLRKAIKWLYNAQHDYADDYGWGFLPDMPPSSVSCTASSILVLIRASELNKDFGYHDASLTRGINTLESLGQSGFWKGDIEDFGVEIDGKYIGRHTTGGLGTLLVARTFIKAVENDLLSPTDSDLWSGLSNISSRCQTYPGKQGLWLIPSDQGGPPIIWNSAQALDVLYELKQLHLSLEGSYVDSHVYQNIYTRVNLWRKATFALIMAIIGVGTAFYLRNVMPIIESFSQLPILVQGLVFIFLTIVIEELYARFKPMSERFLKRRKY